MKTEDVIRRLQARYPMFEGKWATLVEFQRIDFLAVGTWPSTGFVVHGFEIKVSRNDWLRELKDPGKSVEGRSKVDHWWLAAPDDVIKEGELPDGWGHLRVTDKGTYVVTDAPTLRDKLPKKWAGNRLNETWAARSAFAGMARRVAYAEADRDSLLGVLDTHDDASPALDAAAILTGRNTEGQKAHKKRRNSKKRRSGGGRSRSQRRKEWEAANEVGW